MSLDVCRGEIVGITGLVGSGYEQVLALIFGAMVRQRGEVTVAGLSIEPGSPHGAIRAGLGFVAADRKRWSGLMDWSLRENVTLPEIPSQGPFRWLAKRAEGAGVRQWLEQLEVTPPDPEQLFSSLSGGNQQKVVLARWLRCRAKVMLLDEPTTGVDIGAKQAIYRALGEMATAGSGIVLSSSDAEELCAICDRVIVMRQGRIGTVLGGSNLNVDRLISECIDVRTLVLSGNN